MRDEEWQGLADEALERLLIERWLYRGMMLGVIFLSAIVATYLGIRGIGGLVDQVTLGVVLALALAAATVAWTPPPFPSRFRWSLILRTARRGPAFLDCRGSPRVESVRPIGPTGGPNRALFRS